MQDYIYILQVLLKIQSFLPYLTQWKATAMPYGKPAPAGKDAAWQVLACPFMTSFANIQALLLSLPVHSVDGVKKTELTVFWLSCTTTQLNLLLGLKNTFFQGTSFNVDSSSRQNICSVETNKQTNKQSLLKSYYF